MLGNAGFSKIQCEKIRRNCVATTAAIAAYGLVRGGSLYNEIVRRDPDLVKKITDVVAERLSARFGSEPMTAPMSALFTRAYK